MKYAIIKTGGKQYKVSEGDVIEVEQLPVEIGNVTFDSVLLFADGESVDIGNPLIAGITVEGKLLSHMKGKKIRVSTFKSKIRVRRVRGHRQHLSQVKIEKIAGTAGSQSKAAKKAQ